MRPGNTPYCQLRIISDGCADADNNSINQRPQSMQVLQSGWTVDVFRMPRFRCDPAIKRLAELANDNEIVHLAAPKRAEQIRPGLRQRLLPLPKQGNEVFPGI